MSLRTAVVGLGSVAELHLDALDANERSIVVAVCDTDADVLERYVSDAVAGYDSLEELLASESLDWVHVCTPIQLHYDQTRQCLEAGVHVLLEKPATQTVAEYEHLLDIAAENGVTLDVVHSDFWFPASQRLATLLSEGALGQVRSVEVLYSHQSRPDESVRGDWVFELLGGEFEEGLSHPLYMGLRFAGYPAEETVSTTRSASTTLEYDIRYDSAAVSFQSIDGVHCSVIAIAGAVPHRLIRVTGDRGLVELDLVTGTLRRVTRNHTRSPVDRVGGSVFRAVDALRGAFTTVFRYYRLLRQYRRRVELDASPDPHYAIINRAVKTLLDEQRPTVPHEEVRWTLQLIEKIRQA